MNNQVLINRELLERLVNYDDNHVRAIARADLREILATPAPVPDAGEGVDFWWADEPLAGRALVMKVADHNRIVSALQASAMVVPDIARFEKHAMKARECLSECDVVLLSSIRRLLADAPPTMSDSNGLGPIGPAPGDSH